MPMGCGEMNEKAAILIVEDDAVMRETCIRMLSRAGYTTEAVADGEAALATLREDSQFRIVLLDLKLPKIDGTVVLKRIRASDADVKVIIMTGFATIKSAVQTMKLGAVDYLVKPFEKDELLAVVAQQLRVGELEERVANSRKGSNSCNRSCTESTALTTSSGDPRRWSVCLSRS
jgi:DNA-binding NtrC family response regulator